MIAAKIKNLNLIKMLPIFGMIVVPLLVNFPQKDQTAYAETSSRQVTVMAANLNVREAPSTSSKIIDLVHKGDTFEIIQKENNWDRIKLSNNETGWVNRFYLAQTENIGATVEAIVLRVHKGPDLFSQVAGKLKLGTKITVEAEYAGWAKVAYGSGNQGWVYENYITKETPSEKIGVPSDITDKKKSSEPPQQTLNSDAKTLSVAEPAQNEPSALKGKTIVLDPGHGGEDSGTISFDGTYEKTLTLATAQVVKQKLENAGANVIMTRTTDTYVPLQKRADISNQNHADAFISFHYNWSNDPTVNGLTDFYYQTAKDGPLATDILNEVAKSTNLNNIGATFDNLSVLRNNLQPSTLIELGFVSSKQEDLAVESSSYRDKVAQGVYQGLLDYFQSKNN